MKKKTGLALLVLAAVLIALAVTTHKRLDIRESQYPTMAQAREDQAIQHGWLPEFLPPSATDIRERHDLDTNAVILRFHFPVNETGFWNGACQPVDLDQAGRPDLRPDGQPDGRLTASASWWPQDLFPEPGASPAYDFLACPASPGTGPPRLLLAIDPRASLALAWSAAKRP